MAPVTSPALSMASMSASPTSTSRPVSLPSTAMSHGAIGSRNSNPPAPMTVVRAGGHAR